MRVALAALAAVALAAQTAEAALTCPFDLQSKVASTLASPPTASSSSSSGSSDGSSSKTDKKNKNKGTTNGSSSGATGTDVGNSDDGDSDDNDAGAGSTTPAPGTTTAAPSTTTAAPGTTTAAPPGTTTVAPSRTTASPSTTTAAPTTTTAAPAGTNGINGTLTIGRWLAEAAEATTAPPADAGVAGVSANGTTPVATTAGETTAPPTVSDSKTSNSTGSSNSTASTVSSFTCDETFYKQWDTLGLKCGGESLDAAKAAAAASCVVYSGTLGVIPGTTCMSMCAFPGCDGSAWQYGASNGIASSVYSTVGVASFLPSDVAASVASRLTGTAVLVGNTTLTSQKQCAYSGDSSFSSCSCSALSKSVVKTDTQIKRERENDLVKGVISKDNTTTVGSVLAPTTQSLAGMTVLVSAVAAVASTAAGSVSAASASVAAAGANVGVFTIEICQFGVMINQMKLEGKSAALALFGKQMAPSAFTFLPFGKLNDTESASTKTSRRLTDNTSSDRGVAQYSRTLGIREDMLFLVTLAGVIVVIAAVFVLFGLGYAIAPVFMSREDFMTKFFDKMIGVLVLVAILSQYTIGVTGTYQIYYSSQQDNLTDPKCILAMVALLGLALGIVFYGYVIVQRYEDDIRDVGTAAHVNKKVCQRYGPFYDEYKFKNRFFFAAKLMLALVCGVITGYVGMQAKYQVSILLAAHVFFFFYLEVQSPHHSRFVQTTTSFVTIMKIAVLALTFFLINATASSELPSDLQNGISLAIVGLNLFVLFLLMIRSLYAFWKKYQLQRDANEANDDQSAAQEYFKEDVTPQQAKGLGHNDKQNPYVHGGANTKYDYNDGDDIRLRSATHMEDSNTQHDNYEEPPAVRYDQISRNGAQHYIVNQPNAPEQRYSGNPQYHQQQQQQQYGGDRYQGQQQYGADPRMQPQQQYVPEPRQYSANPRAPYAATSNEQFTVANSREQALYNQRRNDVVEL